MVRRLSIQFTASMLTAVSALGESAIGQCLSWQSGFELAGCDQAVTSFAVFDDGSGPTLYTGGYFHSAGGQPAYFLARWTGANWTALAETPYDYVHDMIVFDDGSGPALYVGGRFDHVGALAARNCARWNGTTWSALGGGTTFAPWDFAVFDDGSGPALYTGGSSPGLPQSTSYIAKWNGTTWTDLPGGPSSPVFALAVFDDGTGPALYAGGSFTAIGGVSAQNVARWDGTTWSALGAGTDDAVYALRPFDDGTGPGLYVGGRFSNAGGSSAQNIARWRASGWSSVGSGFQPAGTSRVIALHAHDDGSGLALYAAGSFAAAGAAVTNCVARWDGSAWSGVGVGSSATPMSALATFDEGSGPRLFAGGGFTAFGDGTVAHNVGRWDGTSWSTLGTSNVPNRHGVRVLQAYDSSSGPKLVAGGVFDTAGNVLAKNIASYDGTSWAPLGNGSLSIVRALAARDEAGVSTLYAGGFFTTASGAVTLHAGKWDGAAWSSLGDGPFLEVYALCFFDSGGGAQLYAAGRGIGISHLSCVKRWDGVKWWDVGCFALTSAPTEWAVVFDLEVYDAGSGPRLHATGHFDSVNSLPCRNIAAFDGTSWSALGSGLATAYYASTGALAVYDDGTGPALYVGGEFAVAGGGPAANIARWNGSTWSALGSGLNSYVSDLVVFDDGSGAGSALVATGHFTDAGGTGAGSVAAWSGGTWHTLGTGVDGVNQLVYSGAAYDAGAGPDLYIGGLFHSVSGIPSSGLASWRGCGATGELVCFGDGSGTPCPCGNASAPLDRAGCTNSLGTGGTLRGSGDPSLSVDTFALHASGLPATTSTLFFQGTTAIAGGSVFGDGLRCAGGFVVRIGTRTASAGSVGFGVGADPSVHAAGMIRLGGVRRTYQASYRNMGSFCTPSAFNLTNAVSIVWAP